MHACVHATHPDELEGGVLEARLNLHHRLLGLVFVCVTILAREMHGRLAGAVHIHARGAPPRTRNSISLEPTCFTRLSCESDGAAAAAILLAARAAKATAGPVLALPVLPVCLSVSVSIEWGQCGSVGPAFSLFSCFFARELPSVLVVVVAASIQRAMACPACAVICLVWPKQARPPRRTRQAAHDN